MSDNGYQQFLNPTKTWYNNRRLITLNAWIFLLLLSSSTCGYDGSMMNGLQSLNPWAEDFGHPTGGKLGILVAMEALGALCGYPFAPYLTDGIGRRFTMIIGALIMIVASLMQGFSSGFNLFLASRFFVGFGLAFNITAAPILVTELAYPSHRGPLSSVFNSLWYSGSVSAAATTLITFSIGTSWSWRIPSLVQAFPSLLQVCLLWWMPESPRWLISKGREAEAKNILTKWHADGDPNDPLVQYEFESIKHSILVENSQAETSYLVFLKTPGNRKRASIIIALGIFSQWSGVSVAAFYLNVLLNQLGIRDPRTQLIINVVLAIWNLFFAVLGAFLVDYVGRRPLFLFSVFSLLVFFAVDTACFALFSETGSQPAAKAFLAFLFLSYGAYDIAFIPMMVSYPIEILPFHLRAKGFTLFTLSIATALVWNTYVNPIALEAIGWKYFVIYTVWIAFEALFLYLFVIETKNLSLEETAVVFDGKKNDGEKASPESTKSEETTSM